MQRGQHTLTLSAETSIKGSSVKNRYPEADSAQPHWLRPTSTEDGFARNRDWPAHRSVRRTARHANEGRFR